MKKVDVRDGSDAGKDAGGERAPNEGAAKGGNGEAGRKRSGNERKRRNKKKAGGEAGQNDSGNADGHENVENMAGNSRGNIEKVHGNNQRNVDRKATEDRQKAEGKKGQREKYTHEHDVRGDDRGSYNEENSRGAKAKNVGQRQNYGRNDREGTFDNYAAGPRPERRGNHEGNANRYQEDGKVYQNGQNTHRKAHSHESEVDMVSRNHLNQDNFNSKRSPEQQWYSANRGQDGNQHSNWDQNKQNRNHGYRQNRVPDPRSNANYDRGPEMGQYQEARNERIKEPKNNISRSQYQNTDYRPKEHLQNGEFNAPQGNMEYRGAEYRGKEPQNMEYWGGQIPGREQHQNMEYPGKDFYQNAEQQGKQNYSGQQWNNQGYQKNPHNRGQSGYQEQHQQLPPHHPPPPPHHQQQPHQQDQFRNSDIRYRDGRSGARRTQLNTAAADIVGILNQQAKGGDNRYADSRQNTSGQNDSRSGDVRSYPSAPAPAPHRRYGAPPSPPPINQEVADIASLMELQARLAQERADRSVSRNNERQRVSTRDLANTSNWPSLQSSLEGGK